MLTNNSRSSCYSRTMRCIVMLWCCDAGVVMMLRWCWDAVTRDAVMKWWLVIPSVWTFLAMFWIKNCRINSNLPLTYSNRNLLFCVLVTIFWSPQPTPQRFPGKNNSGFHPKLTTSYKSDHLTSLGKKWTKSYGLLCEPACFVVFDH